MLTITQTLYQCQHCKTKYASQYDAEQCEAHPVTQDKGAKVGSTVRILHGDGTGKLATVTDTFIYSRDWGHYSWKTYWHTIGVNAKLNDDWGSRRLTFMDYEVVK